MHVLISRNLSYSQLPPPHLLSFLGCKNVCPIIASDEDTNLEKEKDIFLLGY